MGKPPSLVQNRSSLIIPRSRTWPAADQSAQAAWQEHLEAHSLSSRRPWQVQSRCESGFPKFSRQEAWRGRWMMEGGGDKSKREKHAVPCRAACLFSRSKKPSFYNVDFFSFHSTTRLSGAAACGICANHSTCTSNPLSAPPSKQHPCSVHFPEPGSQGQRPL